MEQIQMVDLRGQYARIKSEVDAGIREVIDSAAFVKGGKVAEFQHELEQYLGVKHVIPVGNGTDALQIALMALGLKPGDEVIVPTFTFVAAAEVAALLGLVPVLVDVDVRAFNVSVEAVERAITPRTKVIVPVHYAGVACDMDAIMALAERHHLFVVEDAAQAIDSYHIGKKGKRPLGSIGHLGCFSFHETKNLVCGEGGLWTINDPRFLRRAEIIWEKGTNRAEFFRGEVNKYGWVDIGSSFLPSEIIAAFLYAQCAKLDDIQARRIAIWNAYYEGLKPLAEKGFFTLPSIPAYATNNAHMFYLLFPDLERRTDFIQKMKGDHRISCVFHYLSLHKSPYYLPQSDGRDLPNADAYSDRLVRLPMYYEVPEQKVIEAIYRVLMP